MTGTELSAPGISLSLREIGAQDLALSPEDTAMLNGTRGAPRKLAMQVITAMAAAEGARRLIDVSDLDMRVNLFGREWPTPLVIAPAGSQKGFHPDGELATARELLREITGEYIAELSAPKDDFPLVSPNPADEGSWIDLAMDQNLALVSSRFDEEIARDEIKSRRTGHYPTLDLVASYDTSDTDISNVTVGGQPTANPNFPTDSSSDSIFVQFNLPIFAGGRTSSRVREAVYLHRASLEQLQRVSRETERAARDAYLGVLSEISRVNALAQAVESSRTALEATQAGFEVGTRTIVDVLNSQRSLYVAITNYYQSRYTYIGNVLRLKLAAGTLQVQDLEYIDQHLVDRRPPEEVIAEEEAESEN